MPQPRIVSLIASATEILCDLDLRAQLVGRSHECDYPADVVDLPVLSYPKVDAAQPSADIDRGVRSIVRDGLSVYGLDVDAIERLRPDLIVTQDHCEVCAVSLNDVTDALCQVTLTETAVCSLHPNTLDDVRADFQKVADAAGVPDRGRAMVARLDARLDAVRATTNGSRRPRMALLEWLAPPMVAGGWMPELARIAGADPVIVDEPGHFRQVNWDDIREADPDLVVVLPCGFDVTRSLAELDVPDVARGMRSIPAVQRGEGYVVDGNALFNRPGPRLAESADVLAAIARGRIQAEHGVRRWR